jgi:hypothetical protein
MMTADLELISTGLANWDGRAYAPLRSISEDEMANCLHRAVVPELEKLRDTVIYLEEWNGLKHSIARVDGTIRAEMAFPRVDFEQYMEFMSRLHRATGRTQFLPYPLWMQGCLIRSRTK